MPKTLTIGIDVRGLQTAKTGTKTYLEEICKEFDKMQTTDIRFHFINNIIPVFNGNSKLTKYIEHCRFLAWKQLILPVKALLRKCDIVFCTDSVVPLMNLGYKTIPVFHDAFLFESPQDYGKLWLWVYMKTAMPAARRSPFIVTPTAYSKRQISKLTGIPEQKLVVVYEGPKTFEAACIEPPEEILKRFSLSPGKYLLHAGSLFKRKNIPALIDAFIKIKTQGYSDLKLVLAGPTPANEIDSDYQLVLEAVDKVGLYNEIVLTGYLTDATLAQLYQHALMYVFPSINEGFGIPLLEAFKYQLPVIAANNTCLPEVGGDAILQFNPFEIDDIAVKIKTVLDSKDLQQEMIRKGTERLQDFSWQKTATELIEVFKKAANYS